MIPTNLKHKPIVSVDYEQRDAANGLGGDAKFLSIGCAQWDSGGNDVSCKIFRKTGKNRWSRQSEELPLWRALDLAIMIAALNKQLPTNHSSIQIDSDFVIKILNQGNTNAHILPLLQSKEIQDRLNELKRWL